MMTVMRTQNTINAISPEWILSLPRMLTPARERRLRIVELFSYIADASAAAAWFR